MHWPDGWAEANLPARRRLMANGLHFTRAQCNTAACSSSRATFLTGLYPAQHGVKNLVACDNPKPTIGQRRAPILSSRLPNLATVMAAAGYHVVLKGKLHLTRDRSPTTRDEAALLVRSRHRPSRGALRVPRLESARHERSAEPDRSRRRRDQQRRPLRRRQRHGRRPGSASCDELHRQSAVHFLNTYDGDKPFCLIVALVNPHDVQEYPGRGVRGLSLSPTFARGGYRFEDFRSADRLPPNIDDDLSTKPSVHASFRQFLAIGTGHVRTRERQLAYARFYAYLNQQVDAQILKVLDALDANGLTERHADRAHERSRRAGHVARPHAAEVLQRLSRDAERPADRLEPAALSGAAVDRRVREPDRRGADAGDASAARPSRSSTASRAATSRRSCPTRRPPCRTSCTSPTKTTSSR